MAFEFFINVGHHFVEAVGVPQSFCDLAWSQAVAEVRGETSQDSYENRRRAIDRGRNEGPGARMAERTFSRMEQPVATPIVEKSRIDERLRAAFSNPPFLMPWPSICSRSRLTSTTPICGSGNIRSWPRQHWPSASATWPGSFPPTPATIFKSPIATSSKAVLLQRQKFEFDALPTQGLYVWERALTQPLKGFRFHPW